jgi:hypothetical protein
MTVRDCELNQDIVGRLFAIFNVTVKVCVVVEDIGIEKLELGVHSSFAAINVDQLLVRISPLRVLVQTSHIRVSGCRIQIVITFLDVLTVVTLGPSQSEQSLFENRIFGVPKGKRKAQSSLAIANPK